MDPKIARVMLVLLAVAIVMWVAAYFILIPM